MAGTDQDSPTKQSSWLFAEFGCLDRSYLCYAVIYYDVTLTYCGVTYSLHNAVGVYLFHISAYPGSS